MVYTVEEFIEDCKAGYLIDDDGCGYYSNSDQDFAEDEKPAPAPCSRGRRIR